MGDNATSGEDDLDAAIDEWWTAFRRARAAALALPRRIDRFAAVTRITKGAAEMMKLVADDRPALAVEIRDEQALSLSQLARVTGVSKPRAQQWTSMAERGDNDD